MVQKKYFKQLNIKTASFTVDQASNIPILSVILNNSILQLWSLKNQKLVLNKIFVSTRTVDILLSFDSYFV